MNLQNILIKTHTIFFIGGNIINIRAWILLILSTISIACASRQSKVNDEFVLTINEAQVSKDIYEVILDSRKNFYENKKVYPAVMTLSFSKSENNMDELIIFNTYSLYYNEETRLQGGLPNKFAGFKLKGTYVLIDMEDSKFPDVTIPKEKVFISDKTKRIKLKYDNTVDMCRDKWDVKNNKLLYRKCF